MGNADSADLESEISQNRGLQVIAGGVGNAGSADLESEISQNWGLQVIADAVGNADSADLESGISQNWGHQAIADGVGNADSADLESEISQNWGLQVIADGVGNADSADLESERSQNWGLQVIADRRLAGSADTILPIKRPARHSNRRNYPRQDSNILRISQENARLRIPAQQNPQHLAAVSRKKPSITVPLPQAASLPSRKRLNLVTDWPRHC